MATSGLRKLFQSARSLAFAGSINTANLLRSQQTSKFSAALGEQLSENYRGNNNNNNNNRNNIINIEDNQDDRLLKVTWEDGEEHLYPHLFLRDHCQCPDCFHPATKSRRLNTVETVDIGIQISDVKYTQVITGNVGVRE